MRVKANQTLPRETVLALRDLADRARAVASTHTGLIKGGTWESDLLNGYIAKLRYGGWTLQAVGDALGISRERARQRCDDATDVAYQSIELPDVPPPPGKPRKVRSPRMRPSFERWLLETYAVARTCRGDHAVGSPERVASEQFWAAVNAAMGQGINGADIARLLGVNVRGTIYAGLKRHGYRKQSPSQKTYMGKPPAPRPGKPHSHCKRGHEFTPENTITAKQGRLCRKCASRRRREAYERQLATVTDLSARRSA